MAKPGEYVRDFLHKKGVVLQLPELKASFPIQEITTSACRVACPAGVNIKAYLGEIARADFEKALEIVKKTNPLPGICGRVCTHPCESECRRGEFDEPLAICALKRFIADYELTHKTRKIEPCAITRQEKIAIVGSGPAGLTAANDLIRMGYRVTLFEEQKSPGGMLINGIPPYRLPRKIIQAEIQSIVELGVELKTDTRVKDINALFNAGYNAVFLAIGAYIGLKLRVPGEDQFQGVIDCLKFLKQINEGELKELNNKKVIVIGGGNSAVDSARSALRLGSKEVRIVYRRSRREMPANEGEIIDAESEGVIIDYLAAPVRILGEDNRLTGVECTKMKLGEPDSSGRRRPVPIPGSEFIIQTDIIVSAISQKPDITPFKDSGIKFTKWDTFEVDSTTLMTSRNGVFAGGDAVTGPNTVIDAIAAGHRAAHAIDCYLRGVPGEPAQKVEFKERTLTSETFTPERTARYEPRKLAVDKRKKTFDEVEFALTEKEAIQEAKRCLRCGPCVECIHCVEHCSKRMIGVISERGKELMMIHGLPEGTKILDGMRAVLTLEGKKTEVKIEPIVSTVDQELCRGCGQCEEVCDYGAIKLVEKEGIKVSEVDVTLCKGCGTCASVCPTGAAHLRFFKSKDIEKDLEDFLGH